MSSRCWTRRQHCGINWRRVRERVAGYRALYRQRGARPDTNGVREAQVLGPLNEVRIQLQDDLARLSKAIHSLVPWTTIPVPEKLFGGWCASIMKIGRRAVMGLAVIVFSARNWLVPVIGADCGPGGGAADRPGTISAVESRVRWACGLLKLAGHPDCSGCACWSPFMSASARGPARTFLPLLLTTARASRSRIPARRNRAGRFCGGG